MRSISGVPGVLVIWITSYVFFLLTLVNNFSASHDSIHYLYDIIHGKELFHQHHLLYHFLASKWMALFPGVPRHYAIESFTALWGSSALSVVYLFFRNRFYLLPFSAATGTAIIGFSYGVWFYSVNIEVYMPPLFFILCALYLITAKQITIVTIRKVAVLHSLAILFHQVNILFTVIVIFIILTNRKNLRAGAALVQYALTGIVIAGGMYFIAGWIVEGHNSVNAWVRWMEGYTVGHGYWQGLSIKTPVHVLTGLSHAFTGGHFIFQLPTLQTYLEHSFSEHGLTDEIFLSSKISPTMAWALTAIAVLFAVTMVILCIRFVRSFKQIRIDHQKQAAPLLLTILVYSAFFCFWMPEILEFWILQMVLIWILLIGTLPLVRFPFNLSLRKGLAALMIAVFVMNYFGSLRWMQNINNDWYYNEVRKISGQVEAGDLVIVDNEWILKDFVRYYTKATVLATDEPQYNEAAAARMTHEVLSRKGKVFWYRNHQFIRSY